MTLDLVDELPVETAHVRITTMIWRVIRVMGQGGRAISLTSLTRRLTRDARHEAPRYVRDLASAGYLEQADGDGEVFTLKRVADDAPAIAYPCPQPIAFFATQVPVQIPRTQDGLWMLMRWLTQHKGQFSPHDLQRAVSGNVEHQAVDQYLRALDRGGFVVPTLTIDGARAYRCDLRHVETPRVAADGAILVGPRRYATMWRSIKMLGYFTPWDLAVAASLPELAISPDQARRYADDLVAGGYLIVRSRPDDEQLYRLRPAMNTGPAAPVVLRARFVWDANLCRVMGRTAAIDEVRP